ncbi:hypothetical protein CEXT_719521 [Caerostris extrusa]|uniref:Uncharacterized protein n=1 Tax=Caerostris extrusa TaxID=172846 RepID=A0AAV4RPV7_CAEEX|nr:hypothetical protein CEXT_719521 [Caerostris extrusa]
MARKHFKNCFPLRHCTPTFSVLFLEPKALGSFPGKISQTEFSLTEIPSTDLRPETNFEFQNTNTHDSTMIVFQMGREMVVANFDIQLSLLDIFTPT